MQGSTSYPDAVDTALELFAVGNNASTTLANPAASGATSLDLVDASKFVAPGAVTIVSAGGTTIRYFTGKSTNTLTGVTAAGQDGTTAVAHAAGDLVEQRPIAAMHSALRDAIIAVQTLLGANLANVWTADVSLGAIRDIRDDDPSGTYLIAYGNAPGGDFLPLSLGSGLSITGTTLSASLEGDGAIDWQGQWVTGTPYLVGDAVQQAGSAYFCLVAHTAGTFATDLAAGKWDLLASGAPTTLSASTTWNPASTANGASATTSLTVSGAAVGDYAVASLSTLPDTSWMISAHVPTTNTVRVTVMNRTGATVDLASGTLRALVFKAT